MAQTEALTYKTDEELGTEFEEKFAKNWAKNLHFQEVEKTWNESLTEVKKSIENMKKAGMHAEAVKIEKGLKNMEQISSIKRKEMKEMAFQKYLKQYREEYQKPSIEIQELIQEYKLKLGEATTDSIARTDKLMEEFEARQVKK